MGIQKSRNCDFNQCKDGEGSKKWQNRGSILKVGLISIADKSDLT